MTIEDAILFLLNSSVDDIIMYREQTKNRLDGTLDASEGDVLTRLYYIIKAVYTAKCEGVDDYYDERETKARRFW